MGSNIALRLPEVQAERVSEALPPASRRQATINVPRHTDRLPCRWGKTTDPKYANISFETLLGVMDFTLTNTFVLIPRLPPSKNGFGRG